MVEICGWERAREEYYRRSQRNRSQVIGSEPEPIGNSPPKRANAFFHLYNTAAQTIAPTVQTDNAAPV